MGNGVKIEKRRILLWVREGRYGDVWRGLIREEGMGRGVFWEDDGRGVGTRLDFLGNLLLVFFFKDLEV